MLQSGRSRSPQVGRNGMATQRKRPAQRQRQKILSRGLGKNPVDQTCEERRKLSASKAVDHGGAKWIGEEDLLVFIPSLPGRRRGFFFGLMAAENR